jgi:hypothetical protein
VAGEAASHRSGAQVEEQASDVALDPSALNLRTKQRTWIRRKPSASTTRLATKTPVRPSLSGLSSAMQTQSRFELRDERALVRESLHLASKGLLVRPRRGQARDGQGRQDCGERQVDEPTLHGNLLADTAWSGGRPSRNTRRAMGKSRSSAQSTVRARLARGEAFPLRVRDVPAAARERGDGRPDPRDNDLFGEDLGALPWALQDESRATLRELLDLGRRRTAGATGASA